MINFTEIATAAGLGATIGTAISTLTGIPVATCTAVGTIAGAGIAVASSAVDETEHRKALYALQE